MVNAKKLVILTAGGTGGHIYPAEALARKLKDRGYELIFITDKRGLNNYHGTLSQIKNISVLSGPLMGKSKITRLTSLIKLALGLLQSMFILLKYRPLCVVGFGGYASFPCCVAAILLKKKLVLHEQNSVMSRTNRFLAKYATLIATSFSETKFLNKSLPHIHSGMPVRESISQLFNQKYTFPQENENLNILILGGSQGAKIFSQTVPEAIKLLPTENQKRLNITQQCRQDDVEKLQEEYKNIPCQITISSFFNNMPEIYAKTHLVISRSGASSVTEIAAAGVPAIFVPLPTSADDHQNTNAKPYQDCGGGLLIPQNDFTSQKLACIINDILSQPQKLQTFSDNMKKIAIIDADTKLADAVENICSRG